MFINLITSELPRLLLLCREWRSKSTEHSSHLPSFTSQGGTPPSRALSSLCPSSATPSLTYQSSRLHRTVAEATAASIGTPTSRHRVSFNLPPRAGSTDNKTAAAAAAGGRLGLAGGHDEPQRQQQQQHHHHQQQRDVSWEEAWGGSSCQPEFGLMRLESGEDGACYTGSETGQSSGKIVGKKGCANGLSESSPRDGEDAAGDGGGGGSVSSVDGNSGVRSPNALLRAQSAPLPSIDLNNAVFNLLRKGKAWLLSSGTNTSSKGSFQKSLGGGDTGSPTSTEGAMGRAQSGASAAWPVPADGGEQYGDSDAVAISAAAAVSEDGADGAAADVSGRGCASGTGVGGKATRAGSLGPRSPRQDSATDASGAGEQLGSSYAGSSVGVAAGGGVAARVSCILGDEGAKKGRDRYVAVATSPFLHDKLQPAWQQQQYEQQEQQQGSLGDPAEHVLQEQQQQLGHQARLISTAVSASALASASGFGMWSFSESHGVLGDSGMGNWETEEDGSVDLSFSLEPEINPNDDMSFAVGWGVL